MKLRNAKDEKITTRFGIAFLVVGLIIALALFVLPIFTDKAVELNTYSIVFVVVLSGIGLGLILAPDDLYGLLKKKAQEKL